MELKVLKCPNCGANTTDHDNCEYCGSLLVRFVEQDIDLSRTSYTNNNLVIPGLIEELQKNLKLQDENPQDCVATDIQWQDSDGDIYRIGVFDSRFTTRHFDGQACELENGKSGLRLALSFSKFVEDFDWLEDTNKREEERRKKFMHLDSFGLFSSHMSSFIDNEGYQRYDAEYMINFGRDAEGAARLISEICYKIRGLSQNDLVDFLTNVGSDNIERARKNWDQAHGVVYEEEDNENEYNENIVSEASTDEEEVPTWKIVLYVIGLIIFILRILSMIF